MAGGLPPKDKAGDGDCDHQQRRDRERCIVRECGGNAWHLVLAIVRKGLFQQIPGGSSIHDGSSLSAYLCAQPPPSSNSLLDVGVWGGGGGAPPPPPPPYPSRGATRGGRSRAR